MFLGASTNSIAHRPTGFSLNLKGLLVQNGNNLHKERLLQHSLVGSSSPHRIDTSIWVGVPAVMLERVHKASFLMDLEGLSRRLSRISRMPALRTFWVWNSLPATMFTTTRRAAVWTPKSGLFSRYTMWLMIPNSMIAYSLKRRREKIHQYVQWFHQQWRRRPSKHQSQHPSQGCWWDEQE